MQTQARLYQRGKRGFWWVDFGNVGGVRLRKSTFERDEAKARATMVKLTQEVNAHRATIRARTLIEPNVSAEWGGVITTSDSEAVMRRLWKNARSRATQCGLLWALSWDDFLAMAKRSDGRCAVTGLPFTITDEPKHPFKPSIDRLDNSTGYSAGNCRLVLMAVNYAMNVWGEDLFRSIALSYASSILLSKVQIGNTDFRNMGRRR